MMMLVLEKVLGLRLWERTKMMSMRSKVLGLLKVLVQALTHQNK